MTGAERLYTPELLALTVRLAGCPLDESLPLAGTARSRSCGSTLAMRVSLDEQGAIDRIGMRVQACAVGQASAAIFVAAAPGRDEANIADAERDLETWLAGTGPLPGWPGIEVLDAARAYPGRHGAIMLPWRAALAALSSSAASG